MKDFILAALPRVLCGIAVAIICVQSAHRKENKNADRHIAMGLAIGLMLGPAINSIGLWENHGIGIALGPLWGMALASMFKGKDKYNES